MSQIDIAKAKEALTVRLRMWGAAGNHAKLAAGFIDDLVAQGWQMSAQRETRPHPPRPADQCPHHPGQWAENCGGCAADRRGQGGYDEDDRAPMPPRAWDAGDHKSGADACRAALRGGDDA